MRTEPISNPSRLVFYKHAFVFIGCIWMISSFVDSRLNRPKLAFGIHALSSLIFSAITYKGTLETESCLRALYSFIGNQVGNTHLTTLPRGFALDESVWRLRASQKIGALHFILQTAFALMSRSNDESYFRSPKAATTSMILIISALVSFLLLYIGIHESEILYKTASRASLATAAPTVASTEDRPTLRDGRNTLGGGRTLA